MPRPSANFLGRSSQVTKSPVRNTASGFRRLMWLTASRRKNGSVNSSRWMSLSCATRKPSKAGGKAGEKYFAARDLDPMPLDLTRIKRQASAGARACGQEAAPRDVQLGGRLQQYPNFIVKIFSSMGRGWGRWKGCGQNHIRLTLPRQQRLRTVCGSARRLPHQSGVEPLWRQSGTPAKYSATWSQLSTRMKPVAVRL